MFSSRLTDLVLTLYKNDPPVMIPIFSLLFL